MMANNRPKLELVSFPKREAIRAEFFTEPEHQGNLFATPRKGLLIFVYFPDVTEHEFRSTVSLARPSKILELRSAPRFDIGSLNRKLAFQLFSETGSTYIDLTSSGNLWNAEYLVSYLRTFVSQSQLSAERPLMLLLSASDSEPEKTVEAIRHLIASVAPQFTDVFEVPHFAPAGGE